MKNVRSSYPDKGDIPEHIASGVGKALYAHTILSLEIIPKFV
jgi:hypothetical protein